MTDTTPAPLTRTVDGTELPAPGTYTLDASHTHVGLSVRHMMVAKTKGRFAEVSGTVVIAEDPLASSVEVEIQAASIDTRDETRDGHLRSPDFLDVETFPTLTYRSTKVTPVGGGRWSVAGDLTVKGITKPVALEVSFEGAAASPFGGSSIGFEATAELDREDFGLTWNQTLETGGVLVGKAVKVSIDAEAIAQ